MAFVKDLYRDEIRNGWLVMSDAKKVWNRQLEIWAEVDRICQKHAIKYHINYGTLIGAARHKGFVPWDDDMDLCMMRPEFNRFCAVLADELNQSGGVFEVRFLSSSAIGIAHSQTTLLTRKDVQAPQNPQESKGLLIDIFALDIAPDGTRNAYMAVNALNELMGTAYNFPAIVRHVQNGGLTVNAWEVIEQFHALSPSDKFEFLKIFSEGVFGLSSNVAWIEDTCKDMRRPSWQKAWFDETIYLPFETIKLPAPKMFDEILTIYYGDWRTPVFDGEQRLGVIHSADIPYEEFWRRVDIQELLRKNF